MTASSALIEKTRRLRFIHLLALQLVLFPMIAQARGGRQDQAKQPLGSLSSVGQVYVGSSVAPAESTVFTGDALRTDDMATATFNISGKGTFEIASRTQLLFAGRQQYVAELKSGVVVLSSSAGPSGINLKVGNFVVVAVTQQEQSTARVETAADGSFVITCSEGNIGIVPLEGAPNGMFLQSGQFVTISPQGDLSTPAATLSASNTTTSPAATTPAQQSPPVVKTNHTGLIILGLAGGGAAIGAAAALAGHHGGGNMSPSSP